MSGFLATADLQAEWQNLDLCTESWKESVRICKKYHLKYIVFCGDGKEVYDPVSIRVIKWWQWAIDYARAHGLIVLYLRGNHDRIATYDVAGSWLSILKRAGAITFDSPGVYDAGKEGRFFFLPFAKIKTLKKWMKQLLAHKPDPKTDTLFFHANLLEARYSQHGVSSSSLFSVHDLKPSSFRYVIGGDVHLPQKIAGNCYYTGSSFCHDWGEVNQRKRYLVVRDSNITSVHSKIPRWFDTGVPGFHRSKPSSFEGSRVRIKVDCDAEEDYGKRLREARRKAERLYKGAEIITVPKFAEREGIDTSISTTDSDERKLKKYMEEVAVKHISKSKVLEYLLYKLSHFAGGLRGKSSFEFIKAYGKYFLSFKRVNVDFHSRGITVIKGENFDRQRKSNGSGKTGYMQIIPVTYFGQTFKKQKHDHWTNRWFPKKCAITGVVTRDEQGNVIEVIRGRRPTQLKLLVNGHNESSGMKSTDRTGTQAQIEAKLGFTWETLANAVYIDRSVANAFLSGTNKQRTDVLSRFQNLERFEKALKLVKKDVSKNEEDYTEASEQLERIRGSIQECVENLGELKELQRLQIKKAYVEYKHYKSKLRKFIKKNRHKSHVLKVKEHKLEKLYKEALEQARDYEQKAALREARLDYCKKGARKWLELQSKSKCPLCFQGIDRKWLKKYKSRWIKQLKEISNKAENAAKKSRYADKTVQMLDGSHSEVEIELAELERAQKHLEVYVQTTYKQYQQLRSEQHTAFSIIGKTKQKLFELQHKKNKLKQRKEKLNGRRLLYMYAVQAFSRDGIPAFLNRNLCPVLNRASDYYAELFSDKEIQVRFKVENGEFVPQIINTKGGEDIEDQSTGERALAGLIASFALREVAPKTNLLMLDEPAEGLDEQTSKQFARGLIELKKRFKTIFITTHNRAIESALSAEHKIIIQKKGGVSRVHA